MTIRTARPNRGQRFRPRTHCLKKLDATVVEMQDPKNGVKGSEQKLNVTTIPHAIAGETPYFWPTQQWVPEDSDYAIYLAKRNIRKKGMLEAYEQVDYNHLHEWLNHKWDFIVMQATEQYKAGRDRNKADRVVFDCQERAFWIVNRPPVSLSHFLYMFGKTSNIFYQQAIMRSKVKSSVSLGALVKYITSYKNHDAFLAPCLPSNPWETDHDAYWTLNMRRVDVPTKMRVERWSFSLFELLTDLRGRDDFKVFLKKEFSGENLAFWEAAEELKWGTASSMSAKAETIFKTFLAPGAPRWINIDGRTMGLTVKGLEHPHRYVLEAAQTHVFMLMKKDTFFRYLKSPTYKEIQKKALSPEAHNFSPAQLEENARNRSAGIHPIILWQQEEEEKAKAAAASAPVDVKAVMSKIDRKK
uniref:Regulator of G protein signaling 9a n=1 Tax=Xiphophorus couchianus TaxID=32473 RepID=A0A3B5LL89_9TELE